MICRAGARGLAAPLTRELNCTHRWPQHLSFVGMQSLVCTSATQFAQRETGDDREPKMDTDGRDRGPFSAGGTEVPCRGPVAYDAWGSSGDSKELYLSGLAQGEARLTQFIPGGNPNELIRPNEAKRDSNWLRYDVLKVRVQVPVPSCHFLPTAGHMTKLKSLRVNKVVKGQQELLALAKPEFVMLRGEMKLRFYSGQRWKKYSDFLQPKK